MGKNDKDDKGDRDAVCNLQEEKYGEMICV